MTSTSELKGVLPKRRATNKTLIKDTSKTVLGKGTQAARQTQLRNRMEQSAEDIIDLMTNTILTGILDGDKVSNGMRLDLMKSFLPYVVPQLKSVEYTDNRPKDLQPLVINLSGGKASIETDANGTHIDIEASDGANDSVDIRKDFIEAAKNRASTKQPKEDRIKSKLNNVISHKTEQGPSNGDPDVPQVLMKQFNKDEAISFEVEGDLSEILEHRTTGINKTS